MTAARSPQCPSGYATPDSFRLYEALEAGCVPLADMTAPGTYPAGVLGHGHAGRTVRAGRALARGREVHGHRAARVAAARPPSARRGGCVTSGAGPLTWLDDVAEVGWSARPDPGWTTWSRW